jgi:uncharacterized membrane protein
MKTLIASLLVVGLVALVGCNQSPTGGTAGEEFRLSAPVMPTSIKQGDTQTITLSVNRDRDFQRDVMLNVDAPKGLRAELSDTKVEASDKGDVTMKISADKDAPVGDHMIKVKGTPERGTPTAVEVKVKIQEAAKAAERTKGAEGT